MKIKTLSIITVVLNDHVGLEKTILSVIEQKKLLKCIEYIVVDGGSKDDTLNILKKYESEISIIISEDDKGIYDAMNKGAKVATGDALMYLNAGDYMSGNLLENLVEAPAFLPVKFQNIFGNLQTRSILSEKKALPNGHQGIIFENKQILYDLKYEICSDYKYFLDHGYDKNIRFLETDGCIMFDRGGVSALMVNKRDKEHFEIRKGYFGLKVACVTEVRRSSRRLLKIFLGKIGLIPKTLG